MSCYARNFSKPPLSYSPFSMKFFLCVSLDCGSLPRCSGGIVTKSEGFVSPTKKTGFRPASLTLETISRKLNIFKLWPCPQTAIWKLWWQFLDQYGSLSFWFNWHLKMDSSAYRAKVSWWARHTVITSSFHITTSVLPRALQRYVVYKTYWPSVRNSR